ncbi:AAA family ATPase [Vibrio fluvialis]
MRRLILDEFITLKNIDVELNKLTVFIGPQASGKSILAKLFYYFNEFALDILFDCIKDNNRKQELDNQLINKFKDLFSDVMWKDKSFNITFQYSDSHSITLNKPTERSTLKVELSEITKLFFVKSKKEFIKMQSESPLASLKSRRRDFNDFKFDVMTEIHNGNELLCFNAYIPAARAFFSVLSDRIFSAINESNTSDIMIAEFGHVYNFSKEVQEKNISTSLLEQIKKENAQHKENYDDIDELIYKVLKGKYVQINGDDFLETEEGLLSIAHTSSGQQESLPLLLSMRMMTYFWRAYPQYYYIEEPEAHLFPEAQYDVLKIIALLSSFSNQKHIVTTHSPYVLSAINNLICLSNVSKLENGFAKLYSNGFNPDMAIDFSGVKAYSVNNGMVKSIIDEESGLIDADMIDSVSNVFGDEFDSLLDLMFEE